MKLCSVFLNSIYEASTMWPNCVGSARQWCKNEQSFLDGKKKCHIWLMPYATNFDGCCFINPAVMRQSCLSIKEKTWAKIIWGKKKSACQFFRFIFKKKIPSCYWYCWNGAWRKVSFRSLISLLTSVILDTKYEKIIGSNQDFFPLISIWNFQATVGGNFHL